VELDVNSLDWNLMGVHIASSDFFKRHEAIMEGEKTAVEALSKIQAIVEKLKQEGRLK
jgi:hypothetical protein